jgi:hypothetical protein
MSLLDRSDLSYFEVVVIIEEKVEAICAHVEWCFNKPIQITVSKHLSFDKTVVNMKQIKNNFSSLKPVFQT